MGIAILFLITLSILLYYQNRFKKTIKSFANEIYKLNYDSVSYVELIIEIEKFKQNKIINNSYHSTLEESLDKPFIQLILKILIILLHIFTIIGFIVIGMFMATMLIIFW